MIKGKYYLRWLEQELSKLEKIQRKPILQLEMKDEIKKCKEAIKMNEEFNNWEEVPDEELFEDGELTNKQAMIKAWDNIFYGKYRLIREKIDATT